MTVAANIGEPEPTAPDVARTLALRLEQLRDPRWLAGAVGDALSRLADAPVVVEDCRIDYCKIKPNRDINAAFLVEARWPGGADAVRRLVSATFYGSPETARLKYEAQSSKPLDGALGERDALRGFRRPMGLVPELSLVVRVFPADPGLPGLGPATDPARVVPLLAEAGLPMSGPPAAGLPELGYEVLHYKPCRSCSLRYRDGNGATVAYGKVYRDDRGRTCTALLRAAWDASVRAGGAWRAARPLAYVEPWRLNLQEAVPGRQFRHLFGDLTHDHASGPELDEARELLGAIAAAIASLQSAPAGPGPALTFESLLNAQAKNLVYLRRSDPAFARRILELRTALAAVEKEVPPQSPVFAHGDFAHGNVLVDDATTVGIIDFDRAGAAEPAYDPAYFLTHMWSFGIRHPRRLAHVGALCEDFRQAYLALRPDVSARRLAVYEALDFIAYVLRNFRKQSHQADWRAWAEGQIDAAAERLDVAAGGSGAAP